VLLVDDDSVDREIVRRAFRRTRLPVEITDAEAAGPALELLAATPNAFDVGLFDLRLPGRDGLELLTEVKALGVDLPVIFMTGQGSEETAVELMKAGADDYIVKGQLTPERLARSVMYVMRLSATERARREVERALRESERGFRRLAENLPDHIARFDASGRFLYANARLPWRDAEPHMLLGCTLGEVGASPPEVLPALESRLAAALAGEIGQVTIYAPVRVPVPRDPEALVPVGADDAPDPTAEVPRWIEVRFVPEETRDGGSPTVLSIARDVTAEVARLEEERHRAEFERQLIGIVSHDLRNPIGAVLMTTSVLTRKCRQIHQTGDAPARDPAVERALDLLDTSARRARRMVSDILDFTKARLGGGIPLHPERVDLVQVVKALVAETRATHPERTIELVAPGEALGYFDGDRVAQALSNLIVNALAYSDPEAVVDVDLELSTTEVILAVTNRGETIPDDVLPRLFKPFQRGDTPRGDDTVGRSVGLGLFIVDRIVEGHRGRIEVQSESGVTTFRMILPRRRPSGPVRALPARAAPSG